MPHSRAEQAQVAARRKELLQLRREGVSFRDQRILDLGYSSSDHASKDLVRALQQALVEQKAEVSVYRQQENERLDALLEAVWDRATTPSPVYDKEGMEIDRVVDLKAVDTVLKLMDRRAKLNGYDMPVKAEVSGPGGGAVQIGPVALNELRDLIDTAGDPDDEDDPDEDEDDFAYAGEDEPDDDEDD
jgi:hypothetical protein